MINIYYFFLVVILLLCYFYRKPVINVTDIKFLRNFVMSPAYGTIKKIIIKDDIIHIIIYLSLFDIHRQYYPTNGIVIEQIHDMTGKYELAYELNKSSKNEKVITTI